jgi:hypothetical protein
MYCQSCMWFIYSEWVSECQRIYSVGYIVYCIYIYIYIYVYYQYIVRNVYSVIGVYSECLSECQRVGYIVSYIACLTECQRVAIYSVYSVGYIYSVYIYTQYTYYQYIVKFKVCILYRECLSEYHAVSTCLMYKAGFY